ncbi:hypothetical protein BCR43DRAFT_421993, partial [Syncephalastrum racemosum]
RLFSPPSGPQGYSFVYLHRSHRLSHSEVRKAMRDLDVDQSLIIDVNFPVKGVVGLLVHDAFTPELRERLRLAKIPLQDFDPLDPSHVTAPEFTSQSHAEKIARARELYQGRMLAACLRMPKAHLGLAVLQFF